MLTLTYITRDATLAKVEALFDARLRGLEEAARRGEAGVQQQMETAIMEVRAGGGGWGRGRGRGWGRGRGRMAGDWQTGEPRLLSGACSK